MKLPKVTLGKFAIRSMRFVMNAPHAANPNVALCAFLEPAEDVTGFHSDITPEVATKHVYPENVWIEMTPRHRAEVIRAILIEAVTHEVDEWLRVDGERVVEPHPENVAKITGVKP